MMCVVLSAAVNHLEDDAGFAAPDVAKEVEERHASEEAPTKCKPKARLTRALFCAFTWRL